MKVEIIRADSGLELRFTSIRHYKKGKLEKLIVIPEIMSIEEEYSYRAYHQASMLEKLMVNLLGHNFVTRHRSTQGVYRKHFSHFLQTDYLKKYSVSGRREVLLLR